MRLNKNIKIFINYFLGPLLFIWLSWSIYNQLQKEPHLSASWYHIRQSFQSSNFYYLVAAIIFMPVNWGLEAAKWKISLDVVYPVSFAKAFKAVLSGVSFSVTMPNRIGEYLGRIMYMPDGKRLKVISLAITASISQLAVTLILGTIAFLLFKKYLINAELLTDIWYRIIAVGLISVTALVTAFYFLLPRLEKWLEIWLKNSSYIYLIQSLHRFSMQRLSLLLLLSLCRYLVFVMQYILLFRLFDIDVSPALLFGSVSLLFLTLAIVPTIALADLGIRGKVSLQLIGIFTTNSLGILLTSVTAWFINLVVPALAGSILILSIKVFKRRYEKV